MTPLRLSLFGATAMALLLSGCDETTVSPYDAGADFAIPIQVSRVSIKANTCCIVANQENRNVLYLANPKPSEPNSRGIQQPARGELHLADPYGADYVLSTSDVPANGYDFTPNGSYAMFTKFVPGSTGDQYSFNMATLTFPQLQKPNVITPIATGLFSDPLNHQSFVTPTGRFLIVASRDKTMERTPDLHVVDLTSGKDIFAIGGGAFAYIEILSSNDVMYFQNAEGSMVAGVPTTQGLYAISLDAAIYSQVEPALIDIHTANVTLHADDHSLIYTRTSGELMLFDMRDQTKVKLADNVVSFTLGPARRGPLAYITTDRALHVRALLNEEFVTTAPASIDYTSPISFSPDGQHLYFFRNFLDQDKAGDLWHVGLPPSGTGTPTQISPRVSNRTMLFERDRMVIATNVSDTGDTGDLVTLMLDGTDPVPLVRNISVSAIAIANPQPAAPPPPQGVNYGPLDMSPPFYPSVLASLTAATLDPNHTLYDRPIDESRALLGTLALSRSIDGPVYPIANQVHSGMYRFTDDGYLLFYVANASWDENAINYVGTLALQSSAGEPIQPPAALSGISEIGPISADRSFYVNAPGQVGGAGQGVYFIKY